MVKEGDLTLFGEHTILQTDDVLQNCKPETYIIVLANVNPISSIHFLIKKKKKIKRGADRLVQLNHKEF